ncbi:MAG TPA: hypothetical protein VKE74_22700 [Gemmataceae bacterium]|nr:hypothetical protein [Gemmataceae bacterium]
MRMRCWVMAAAVVAVAAVAPNRATAQPAKGGEPTVEVRIQSVNVLLDKAEYIGGLLGKEDVIVQVRELVKQLSADGKGIEGVDPKRPFGAYAYLEADVVNSPLVVMIPIADKDRFLQMLKDRLSVIPEKAEGGTLKAALPLVNEAYFKFENGYLYAARDAKHLDAKMLANPKTYFATDDGSVASVLVRIDKIPDDLKTFAIGQLELQAQEALKKQNPTAVEKKLATFALTEGIGGAKMILDDGKTLTVKVFIDPKSDELSAEVVLTPKDGTTLAKNIAELSGKTSLPAGIASAKDPVVRSTVKLGVPSGEKARFARFVDEVIADAIKEAKDNEREVVKKVLTTLAPTVKAGELDIAAVLSGPNAKGKYTLLAAVTVKDGKAIEALAKEFSAQAPADEVEFSFDVEKVGEFSLHKIVGKRGDPQFERVFGTTTIWLATSPDCFAVSIEPDGAALKAALKAGKPAPVPVLSVEVAAAKLLPVVQPDLKPDELKAALKDAFGDSPAGKDTITVTVEGGKQLSVRAKAKGKVLKLAVALDAFKLK